MKFDWSKLTTPADGGYKLEDPKPNNIIFYNTIGKNPTQVLCISSKGITANPDIPVDEAAQAVIRALNGHIQSMIEKASKREWVGLTYQEVYDLDNMSDEPSFDEINCFARSIQAKLKEKNT